MRDREEIKQKLQYLYNKRLTLRKKKYLKKSFMNCKWNQRCPLGGKSLANQIAICKHCSLSDEEMGLSVCNDDQTAEGCSLYENKHTEESIEEQFLQDVSDPTICGQKEPKIAILMWLLSDGAEDKSDFPKEGGESDYVVNSKKVVEHLEGLSLWERVQMSLSGIHDQETFTRQLMKEWNKLKQFGDISE